MNITLSDRVKTVLTRFVEVTLGRMVEDAKKVTCTEDDDNYDYHYVKRVSPWKLVVSPSGPSHHEDCPHEDEPIPYDRGCNACDYVSTSLRFHLAHNEYPITSVEYGLSMTLETFSTWIQGLPMDWHMCRCKTYLHHYPSPKEGVCRECYIHEYVRSEEEGGDCCICHENEGRWIQLTCAHVIHFHCYKTMGATSHEKTNLKCPLCRERITQVKMDPYDV